MRALGYKVVDLIVEHLVSLPAKPTTRRTGRTVLQGLLSEPLPLGASDPLAVLERVQRDILGHAMHLDHPRFFGFVPGPSNFVGAMADALAAGFNIYAGTWLEGSGPAQVELTTVDWLREACGLPEGAGGLFTSGGSAANLAALATARHVRLNDDMLGAVVYCSDQTHSSVDRAMRLLGFQPNQLRKINSDRHFRLDVGRLRREMAQDRTAGLRPFCVVASAGTTNTGAIDPLIELVEVCRESSLWLHVDGAYGAAAVLCSEGKALLDGLGAADSLVLDPHKWLFQPYEIGCLLVRQKSWLRDTFHILPEYLADLQGELEEINFCDYGPQLTRSFRALKLWMTFQVFGARQMAVAITKGLDMARVAEQAVRDLADWRVLTPASLGIVTFRFQPEGCTDEEADHLNRFLVEALIDDGHAMVSSTTLHDRVVLRMCPINPRTCKQDVLSTVAKLDQLAATLLREESH
jgi:glutamate/tyrosine decarboxylase-like PLP-dependent enzyme